MIKLHRINRIPFVLNSELIQYVEETPDTIITLTNQQKLMVKETMDEVIAATIDYCRKSRGMPLLAM